MSDTTIPITLWLSGRDYRIRIRPEEEELVRLSVKKAADKIKELKQSYAGKDEQDFIAMCLLLYATEQATQPVHGDLLAEKTEEELISKIDKIISDKIDFNA